jgi:hypothetical protein
MEVPILASTAARTLARRPRAYWIPPAWREVIERMIAEDPALREAFEKALAADPAFAKDAEARRRWFYARTPFSDERFRLYPVGREVD